MLITGTPNNYAEKEDLEKDFFWNYPVDSSSGDHGQRDRNLAGR